MLVPIALECLVRIDSILRGEPSPQSWVTGEHLVGTCEAMIGEEIAALMCDCVINQANEDARRIRDCGGLMIDVQVEDHTRVRLAGPGKSALGVLFDQADVPYMTSAGWRRRSRRTSSMKAERRSRGTYSSVIISPPCVSPPNL